MLNILIHGDLLLDGVFNYFVRASVVCVCMCLCLISEKCMLSMYVW